MDAHANVKEFIKNNNKFTVTETECPKCDRTGTHYTYCTFLSQTNDKRYVWNTLSASIAAAIVFVSYSINVKSTFPHSLDAFIILE